jgi:hypothetical protein
MSPEEVNAAQVSYLADHRNDDKGLRMLARLFGADWSARYIATVLFPEKLDWPSGRAAALHDVT